MSTSAAGRVALITGGGRGIGRAVALALAANGFAVVVTGRNERDIGAVVGEVVFGGGKARHLAGDVRDRAHLVAAVAKARDVFGRLDVVVANAGVGGRVLLGGAEADTAQRHDEDLDRARAIFETNLLGTYHAFDAAAPVLERGGRLLAMSSVLGKFGVAGYSAYCASKAGVLGLVRAAAHELAPRQITCNAIVPGWVDTDMAAAGIREIAAGLGRSEDEVRAEAERAVPLGRFLTPDEIAGFVVYLCGPGTDGITGQALSMCGGATAFGA